MRNNIFRFLYVNVLKPVLFLMDPEEVHDFITRVGHALGADPVTRSLTGLMFNYSNRALEQNILGIKFKNPVGLTARFDYVIIGVGGVFSAEDAYKKIKLGASLIQLITGMVFECPHLISERLCILRLISYLHFKEDFGNILLSR